MIQRTDKPKGTAFFMGSSEQRAVLHVVTAAEVEALFSQYLDVDAVLESFGGVSAPESERTKEKSDVDIDKSDRP